jgi:hypothetical protein
VTEPLFLAVQVIAASVLAWAAIFAATRLDLQRWVWLPAFRAGAALSLAATGLYLLGFPVPLLAPPAFAFAGVAAGLAVARRRRASTAGGAS